MQEDEFEKQVQKIMDDLSFDPKDAVWSGVAKEIEKDKKRRKPLFWILIIGAPLVISAGYFLSTNNMSDKKPVFNPVQVDSLYKNLSDRKIATNKDSSEAQPNKPVWAASRPVIKEGENRKLNPALISETKRQKNDPGSEELNAENSGTVAPATAAASGQKDNPADSSSNVTVSPLFPPNVTDSNAEVKKPSAKVKKRSAWLFGLTAELGVSGISQSAENQGSVFVPAGSTGGGYTVPVYTSRPAAGFSFSAGAFISRVLSGRVSISGGLNYHYYSTRVTIGNLVSNSGATFNSSMLYFSPAYYTNTSSRSFTNQYHFAELPVSIDFILNKSKDYALIWEAGISFAYLVSADFLYFDPSANVYYKNNRLLNKDQWNVSTALLIGLKMNSNRILLGPQVQYGLSGLLNASPVYSQHLISFGLKISFIPGGK